MEESCVVRVSGVDEGWRWGRRLGATASAHLAVKSSIIARGATTISGSEANAMITIFS